jgi:hypothetical protein
MVSKTAEPVLQASGIGPDQHRSPEMGDAEQGERAVELGVGKLRTAPSWSTCPIFPPSPPKQAQQQGTSD